jgi:hypothetical protein
MATSMRIRCTLAVAVLATLIACVASSAATGASGRTTGSGPSLSLNQGKLTMHIPATWQRAAPPIPGVVYVVSPDGAANGIFTLGHNQVGPDESVELNAAAGEESTILQADPRARSRVDHVRLAGQPALRLVILHEASTGGRTVAITTVTYWVAHKGDLYGLVFQCQSQHASQYAPLFAAAAASVKLHG